MINVGLYYKVKENHTEEFERIFNDVVKMLRSGDYGLKDVRLYQDVEDRRDYMIFTEWNDMDAFKKFIASRPFKETTTYGKGILEEMPKNKVFLQETSF